MNHALFLRNEDQKKTIESITSVVINKFYTIDYTSDYCLDEAIAAGLRTLEDFRGFAARKLVDGAAASAALKAVGAGCSVFAGKNGEKQPLLCRNYDYGHRLTGLLVRCSPRNGYRSIGMADLGFMDISDGAFEDGKTDLSPLMLSPYVVVDGMNEKGVAIAALALSHEGTCQDSGKQKINTTIAIRLVLDRAATVQEAIELLSGYDVSSPMQDQDFHFMIMDAKGVSKVVEYVQNEMKVIDARYVTNAYLTPYMGEFVETPRFEVLRNFVLHRRDRFEEEEAFCVLRSIHQDKDVGAGSSYTRWNAVMNLAARTYNMYYDRDYKNLYSFGF